MYWNQCNVCILSCFYPQKKNFLLTFSYVSKLKWTIALPVWCLQTGKPFNGFNFKHPSPVLCVKVSKTTIYSSCKQGLVKIWDMENAALLRVRNICGKSNTEHFVLSEADETFPFFHMLFMNVPSSTRQLMPTGVQWSACSLTTGTFYLETALAMSWCGASTIMLRSVL